MMLIFSCILCASRQMLCRVTLSRHPRHSMIFFCCFPPKQSNAEMLGRSTSPGRSARCKARRPSRRRRGERKPGQILRRPFAVPAATGQTPPTASVSRRPTRQPAQPQAAAKKSNSKNRFLRYAPPMTIVVAEARRAFFAAARAALPRASRAADFAARNNLVI